MGDLKLARRATAGRQIDGRRGEKRSANKQTHPQTALEFDEDEQDDNGDDDGARRPLASLPTVLVEVGKPAGRPLSRTEDEYFQRMQRPALARHSLD